MSENPYPMILTQVKAFFNRTIRNLDEEDSNFAPTPEAFTAAQQVAHTAQTIDWFVKGAFDPEGFSMDFEGAHKEISAVTSLSEAKAWFDRSMDNAVKVFENRSMEEINQMIPKNPIINGPRHVIVGGISDHTAHHRGALSLYSRLCGKIPPMPYGE
ncbi:MAG: DinB family protein [Candidatus Eisenbacteria bacterium]|uniref:DinB family protein n=1 Tax=Eiseniibacteriota bacterium TaxID=2212470 RepID=A0A948RS60_UNCEI|nr:DinB family protein [Candidatus Eisenbacteria bacterium]MBU1948819.1 DinB family protein [Candidatus Eisenbacteria bacterium]MBU2689990.1 DinB family protein [Candidatus Eisenbacteria bacterium]